MKISDFIHRYPTELGLRTDGICRVRTFVDEQLNLFALLTDLDDKNTAASITNAIETVCGSLVAKGIVPNQCRFVEHYEADSLGSDEFDLVTFTESGVPKWKSITVVVNKDVASSHAAFLNSSGGFRSGFSQTSSFNSQSRVVPVQRSG